MSGAADEIKERLYEVQRKTVAMAEMAIAVASSLTARVAALEAELEAARTVTPEMVERALDESNPYWRNYGAGLREVEREEMRATLEAAMGVNK